MRQLEKPRGISLCYPLGATSQIYKIGDNEAVCLRVGKSVKEKAKENVEVRDNVTPGSCDQDSTWINMDRNKL